MAGKTDEQLILRPRQRDQLASYTHLATSGVDRDRPTHYLRGFQWGAPGMLCVPQRDAHPCQQLGHAEGLGHEVVGAQVEGGHARIYLLPG